MNNLIVYEESNPVINENDFSNNNIEFTPINSSKNSMDKLDSIFNDWIGEKFRSNEYVNIFIPLTFGEIKSDYLGLRLAIYLRISDFENQLSNIFIYSTEKIESLRNHEYFGVLLSKGVELIDYSFASIQKQIKINLNRKLQQEHLIGELRKFNLQIPSDYDINHSITNEWAIYRWAQTLGIKDETTIKPIKNDISNRLYFRYLSSMFKPEPNSMVKNLKCKYSDESKILLIDDEAEKGWEEIWERIINPMYLDCVLEEDFLEQTFDSIEKAVEKKIKDEEFNIIILDFRLTPQDNNEADIHNITGYKLLESIKKINPGIQVIIFSASDKILNYQELQRLGADGIIRKEGVEDSSRSNFTSDSIRKAIQTINRASDRIYLLDFYKSYFKIKNDLEILKKQKSLGPNFVDDACKWLKSSIDLLEENNSEGQLIASFLLMFNVIEKICHLVIKKEPYYNKKNGKFSWSFSKDKDLPLEHFKKKKKNPKRINSIGNKLEKEHDTISWRQKIYNSFWYLTGSREVDFKHEELINKRNSIIHGGSGNRTKISKQEVINLFQLTEKLLIGINEKYTS